MQPPSGRFAVAWQQHTSAEHQGGSGVFGRTFNQNGGGGTPVIQVDPGASQQAGEGRVAVTGGGVVTFAWTRVGGDGNGDVLTRRFDLAGNPLGPEVTTNVDTYGNQSMPSVEALADGGSIVAWQGPSLPGAGGTRTGGTDVYMRRFNAAGNPTGDPTRLNTTETGSQSAVQLAVHSEGDCWAAWQGEGLDGGAGIFGRPLADCTVTGDEVRLNDPVASPSVRSPALAVAPDGTVTAVFVRDDTAEGDGAVVAYALGQPGGPVGTPLPLGTPTPGTIASGVSQRGWEYYSVDLPSWTRRLQVDLSGLSADVDLYLRSGVLPSLDYWDCRSALRGTAPEQCVVTSPKPGRWWIGVNNWDTGTITFTVPAAATVDTPLFADDFESGATGAWSGTLP